MKLKKSINYTTHNEHDELNTFVNDLPNHLQKEMSLRIFNQKYS